MTTRLAKGRFMDLTWHSAEQTHTGKRRHHNEDAVLSWPDAQLWAVADGMGGHASGEVASKMAVDTLREFFRATSADPEATWPYKMDKARGYEENRLITGIKLANLRIHEAAQKNPQMHSMGTTVAGILVVEDGVLIGHVGDSRVYRIRDGKMEQLTSDHSLLNDYIKMKKLTPEEIENFPHKNVIVRELDDDKIPTRPISAGTPPGMPSVQEGVPSPFLLGLLAVSLTAAAPSESEQPAIDSLVAEVQAALAALEADPDIDEGAKLASREKYERALGRLRQAADYAAEADRYREAIRSGAISSASSMAGSHRSTTLSCIGGEMLTSTRASWSPALSRWEGPMP